MVKSQEPSIGYERQPLMQIATNMTSKRDGLLLMTLDSFSFTGNSELQFIVMRKPLDSYRAKIDHL